MRAATLVTMLAASLALASCDSGDNAAETEDMPMAGNMPTEDMPMMGSNAEMRMANAEGTITAIDSEAGTITIDHGPAPAVDWPAMTMTFKADEALRAKVRVGDDVDFDFQVSEAGSQITAISKK